MRLTDDEILNINPEEWADLGKDKNKDKIYLSFGLAEEPKTNGGEEVDPRPPAFTDESIALRFAEKHADRLRYVAIWNKWYVWSGTYWRQDNTLNAFDDARKICRAASAECNSPKVAKAIASAKTVVAVLSLARADRRLAATVDQWDKDDWLLNTPGGTVDLKTGDSRAHCPGDYITKTTAVAPGGDCPRFRKFLAEITDRNEELQSFLQRLLGYSLTGSIREHALAFFYGLGANGKSVLIITISGTIGDYHTTAPIETFTASGSDRHPTELAGFRGARLVTAIETEEGRRWAESRIKALTGGDKISARFMRQDFFEFTPRFKLVIAGNHKPGLRSVDEAIRRRFMLVPFTITIPEKERDDQLGEKLKAEWPGILQWLIDGCLAWQKQGLTPPRAVTEATAAYLESEDALAAWLDEECMRDPNAWTRTKDLFAAWRAWAERSGEHYGNTKQFRERLEVKGIHHKLQPGTKRAGYEGVRLIIDSQDNDNTYWNR
jgi:putative DNA primase/helicase